MAQLTRLTPEVPFPRPRRQGRSGRYMVYGTRLAARARTIISAPTTPTRTNHGIYWIDRDGNRELIYRDPAIACVSPIPLRSASAAAGDSRPDRGDGRDPASGPACQARPTRSRVMNVYNSDFAWPAGTKVAALRVIQLLPKTTAPPNVAADRRGPADQRPGRAGHRAGRARRQRLFRGPGGQAIYFQALDARGLAVQSMRSATYVHPGERLTCQGCHERKHRAAGAAAAAMPLALRRGPLGDPARRGGLPPVQLRAAGAAGAGPQLRGVPPRARPQGHRPGRPIEGNGWTRSYPIWPASTGSISTWKRLDQRRRSTAAAARRPAVRRAGLELA